MFARKTVCRFFFALWLAAGMVAVAASTQSAQAVQNDAEAVTATVSAFYTKYIASLEVMNQPFSLREQPEIASSFADKIDALVAEAASEEPGFLGYDPVLMAQDWPPNMAYNAPVILGNRAEIIAWKDWGDSRNPLCVVLGKSGKTWRITDVIDMDWYEGEPILECGGLKREPRPKG